MNRCHQESPSLLLASWRNRLHSRGSITVSEIQSLSLFPWADINRKPLECRTRTSESTADVRWRGGRAGRKESKQAVDQCVTYRYTFPQIQFHRSNLIPLHVRRALLSHDAVMSVPHYTVTSELLNALFTNT